jgi:hypothetical protein
MDEDPLKEVNVLSLLEGYGTDEAEAIDTEAVSSAGDWQVEDRYGEPERGE